MVEEGGGKQGDARGGSQPLEGLCACTFYHSGAIILVWLTGLLRAKIGDSHGKSIQMFSKVPEPVCQLQSPFCPETVSKQLVACPCRDLKNPVWECDVSGMCHINFGFQRTNRPKAPK